MLVHGSPMGPPWLPWVYSLHMGLPYYSRRMSWVSHATPIDFQCSSMASLGACKGNSAGAWNSHGPSMGLPWVYYERMRVPNFDGAKNSDVFRDGRSLLCAASLLD